MPGRIPNRTEDLARPRERKGGKHLHQTITKGLSRQASIPEASEDWHPIATMLWTALQESGQADFYESSDWAIAYSLMDDISHYKRSKRSGQMLQTIMSSLGSLLVTEGDRRRARIELQEPEPDENEATLTLMQDYRDRLNKAS